VIQLENEELHPTVMEFKAFVNKYPQLMVEIRKSGKSWQAYYDRWVIHGEDDAIWEEFTTSRSQPAEQNNELLPLLLKYAEHINVDKLQEQIGRFDETIQTIQKMLINSGGGGEQAQERKPFNWFYD